MYSSVPQVRHSNVLADDISALVALETIVNYHKTYEKYSDMAHKFMDYQARFGSTGRVETSSRFSWVMLFMLWCDNCSP